MGLVIAMVAAGIILAAVSVLAGLMLRRHLAGDAQAEFVASRRGLSWTQRWQVERAVTRGRQVTDPALAGPVVIRARYVQRITTRLNAGPWRRLVAVGAALQVLGTGLHLVDGGPWSAWRIIVLVLPLLSVPVAVLWPSQLRRAARRAERAEHLNLTPGNLHVGGAPPLWG